MNADHDLSVSVEDLSQSSGILVEGHSWNDNLAFAGMTRTKLTVESYQPVVGGKLISKGLMSFHVEDVLDRYFPFGCMKTMWMITHHDQMRILRRFGYNTEHIYPLKFVLTISSSETLSTLT